MLNKNVIFRAYKFISFFFIAIGYIFFYDILLHLLKNQFNWNITADISIGISIRFFAFLFILLNLNLAVIDNIVIKIVITLLFVLYYVYNMDYLPYKAGFWLGGISMSWLNTYIIRIIKNKFEIEHSMDIFDIALFFVLTILGNIFLRDDLLFYYFLIMATINVIIVAFLNLLGNYIKKILKNKLYQK
ncbi:hypothetical protein FACS189491_07940 [Spirochaetia bacterium]|nr:hypothetical protein FACS189491_07940 [Spirochaetia bacterium]